MMTQTHLLVATAALTRPQSARWNLAIAAGALLPDAAMFVFFAQGVATGTAQQQLWDTDYWRADWQTVFSVFNSLPLYALCLGLGLLVRPRFAWSGALIGFSLAALLHIAFDFPVHVEDAHAHFWPVSDWRFHSPVSYWNRDHHGLMMSAIESGLGLACAGVMMRRFRARWVWALCSVASLLYVIHFGLLLAWPGA